MCTLAKRQLDGILFIGLLSPTVAFIELKSTYIIQYNATFAIKRRHTLCETKEANKLDSKVEKQRELHIHSSLVQVYDDSQ